MRAIDADALKEDLTRFYDNEVTARKLIDEQPTIQPEPHWIPVTERLPVEEGRYLVCGKKGGIYHANYRGRWWTQVGCGGKLVPSVVAWMPLPEPYKGVTE